MNALKLALVAGLAAGGRCPAFASGMVPCSSFIDRSGFHIGDAYSAAELVAVGQVTNDTSGVTLHIRQEIKGTETRKDVPLTVPQCQGTACSGGFSVAPRIDLLFLLRRTNNGVYDSVTGNGNFSCPVVYEIKDHSVLLGRKKVPLASLRRYLQSAPSPVPWP